MENDIRLVKISELDFLICLQNSLFGRKTGFVKDWKIEDYIVFVVDNMIAGVAKISGKCFQSTSPLWINEEFPYRVPITFTHVYSKGERPSFLVHKEELEGVYGKSWGNVFVLRKTLPDHIQRSIWRNIESSDSDPGSLLDGIKARIYEEIDQESDRIVARFKGVKKKSGIEELSFESKKEILTLRMIEFIRNDPDRMNTILNKDSFVQTLSENEVAYLNEVGYSDVRESVRSLMEKQGLYRPMWTEYGPGTYIVLGDSHGDHTSSGMFRLIEQINEFMSPDRIFHIGHITDDNGIINSSWRKINNLTIVSRIEEAHKIELFLEKKASLINVVRDGVWLGDIKVANQDLVSDYMMSRPSSQTIRKKPYVDVTILNHHLHEFDTIKCEDEKRIVSCYPGCICEKHVESIRKCLNYNDDILDKIKRESPYNSRVQRRKWAIKDHWEQGIIVVHIDNNMKYTMVPCRIKRIKMDNEKTEYAISYFDKIISETGVHEPSKKVFINADIHVPLQDSRILSVQDQIVSDYRPDVFINLGDTRNSEGLNHHRWERGEVTTDRLIDEAAAVHHILRKMSAWAKEKYIFYGNHERFARDFSERFPQFKGLVDFEFLSGYKQLGYEMIEHQGKLELNDVVYIHGDMMRGGYACPLDGLSSAFPNKTVVCGHHHYPSIRRGCYSIGYSAKRDQGYNEKTVTRWCHGFGLCNEYMGESWVTTLVIENGAIVLNGKTYSSSDDDFWRFFRFKVELNYIPE